MKVNKEFVLSDSSVNTYGFRLLTSGYLLEEFKKNPIGYLMHNRDAGVLVKWDNLRIEGDRVIGTPDINMSNPQALQTLESIENGYLNAASMGAFVILEMSDDPKLKLQGQTQTTITKWFNRECSIVDIPGNMNALVLYDKNGKIVNLQNLSASNDGGILSSKKPLFNLIDMPNENDLRILIDKPTMLSIAIKNKDISPEMAVTLKNNFNGSLSGLYETICSLADERLRYLMSLPYKELDRSDMMEELRNKYLQGYKRKVGTEIGNVDKVAKSAIEDGFLTEKLLSGWDRNFGKGTIETMNLIFDNAIQHKIDEWMKMTWNKLSENPTDSIADKLKKNYFMGFRQKYFQAFGMEYQEPPKKW